MATIVVVEDNPDNMKLFRAVLRRAGHLVIEFSTGVGLVDAVRDLQQDLILLDIQLPDRDGWQVLGDLRRAFGAIPIVALTALALDDDRARIWSAGFDGMITKPIDVKAFPDAIAAALTRREEGPGRGDSGFSGTGSGR
jgi:two-component system cell cycle response regulator DivK